MTEYRLVAEPRADLDVAAAYRWYESEQAGLGLEFLEQVRIAYDRIAVDPFRYQELQLSTSPRKAMSSSFTRYFTRVARRQNGNGDGPDGGGSRGCTAH